LILFPYGELTTPSPLPSFRPERARNERAQRRNRSAAEEPERSGARRSQSPRKPPSPHASRIARLPSLRAKRSNPASHASRRPVRDGMWVENGTHLPRPRPVRDGMWVEKHVPHRICRQGWNVGVVAASSLSVMFRPYGTGRGGGNSVFYQHSVPTRRRKACKGAKRARTAVCKEVPPLRALVPRARRSE
jgi:hypothetical protein